MTELTRRTFLAGGVAATLAGGAEGHAPGRRPKAIASANGIKAVERAVERLLEGADSLDAAIAGVNLLEDDPNDHTVGLGGLPNEAGVVELDASVMHGPSAKAGAVAALRNIRNPSKVAKLVMERTDHVLLVGAGALAFAKAHGFVEEDLLTDEAREIWLRWKEKLSDSDDWISPPDEPAAKKFPDRPTGTIHLSTIDSAGNLSGATTTSGLAYKLPGRVGDSPIVGAGLFVDNDVGSAGSTGRGEANLLTGASLLVVEAMRAGKSPEAACLAACQRIADKTLDRRLRRQDGRPNFDVRFYALDKQGRHGSAALYKGNQFALHDGERARLLDCAYLYEK